MAQPDPANAAQARIQGLEKDLGMSGQQFNIALLVFFIPYVLLEVPSNIILRKIAPSIWLSSIMVCWGIVTICMGIVKSFAGLLVCRLLLGLFEAGFFPGSVYLISMYYRRWELQWRLNLFFCSAILAGAVSGLLAYVLAKMAGIQGYNGWRWIFIIEGLATVVVAIAGKFLIVDWPETSRFLTTEERALILQRTSQDTEKVQMDRLDKRSGRRILMDWKIYAGTIMYFGVVNTGYGTSFFTPTVLKQLGRTAVRAQLLSIPIYIVASIATLIAAFYSDRLRHRYAFTMMGICLATAGYVVLLTQTHVPVVARYIAVYLITAGGYITQPVCLAWLNNNLGGHYKRSIGTAMQIGFGNLGGIVASNVFVTKQAPTFLLGFGVSLGLLWLCGLASTAFFVGLWFENRKRDRGKRDSRYNLPPSELENLGDDHPRFRFVL